MRIFATIAGTLASLTCIAAGIWLILSGEWEPFGLYFIGKGLFVGPLLVITAFRRA